VSREEKKSISLVTALGLLGWLAIFLWAIAPTGLIKLVNFLYGTNVILSGWNLTKGMLVVIGLYLAIRATIYLLIRLAWSVAK
jgi:hypothetical protein